MLLSRRDILLIASAAVCAFTRTSFAQSPDVWSVQAANAGLEAGTFVLVDVRSRKEWEETGIARGAWPVSLHEDGFGSRLAKALDLAGDRRVGLICASGGRSGYVFRALHQKGVTQVTDISEGMLGSKAGPGWISAGLPVVPIADALAGLPTELKN